MSELLNDAQVESLVITHADFLERGIKDLIPAALKHELDVYLGRAGDFRMEDPRSVQPTVAEAKTILGKVHIALPEGSPEKNRLGQIMRENGLENSLAQELAAPDKKIPARY